MHDPIEAAAGDSEETSEDRPLERPSFGRALRGAATDFYYHSIRLVPANFAWGLVLLAVLMAMIVAGLGFGVLVAPILGIPLVGVHRMAGEAARGHDISFRHFLRGMRERWLPGLVAGIVQTWATLLLAIDILAGFAGTHPLAWALGTIGFWALVGLACLAVAFWPIAGDPARRTAGLLDSARLAALVALTTPGRTLLLALVVGALLVISTIAFALVVTVAVAFSALLAARIVLPEADRIDRMRSGEPA